MAEGWRRELWQSGEANDMQIEFICIHSKGRGKQEHCSPPQRLGDSLVVSENLAKGLEMLMHKGANQPEKINSFSKP